MDIALETALEIGWWLSVSIGFAYAAIIGWLSWKGY